MAKPDNSKSNSQARNLGRARGGTARSWAARLLARRASENPSPARFWWRLLAGVAALWWLGATLGDALLQSWWLRDAQGALGGLVEGELGAASTWSLDYLAAHRRLEGFRWGGATLGALICGGWAWRQGRIAVANARESEASLGALWSVDDSELAELGLQPHQTGRWIPLEDKLALDRFRSGAFWICVAVAALIGGNLGGRAWTLWLGFWEARPVGAREPWLGMDLSFYLFRLPALDFAWRMLLLAHCMALALSLAIYLYEDSLQLGRRLWASARALRHIAVLLALGLCWGALGTVLYPFELLVQRSPTWSGPHAADWFWRVPLTLAGALAALLCAALCVREARRQSPRAVLAWSLAPVALSWLIPAAVPALRQYTLSPADIAREDAPFARAQLSWTMLALGFSPDSGHLGASASAAGLASTYTPRESRPAPLQALPEAALRLALASSPSERDVASWAHADALAGGLSIASDSLRNAGAASTWDAPSKALWQQAEPTRFEPRTWEERHIDGDLAFSWQRFVAAPRSTDDAAAPNSRSPLEPVEPGFVPSAQAGGPQLQQVDRRTLPILIGIDRADSPGLLLDSEVAEAMAIGSEIRQFARKDASATPGASRWRARPVSFFNSSFNTSAQLASLGELRSLPAFRVLQARPRDAKERDAKENAPEAVNSRIHDAAQSEPPSGAGVALDLGWKKWLAAWRLGSPSLARSPRLGQDARLAWKLDASQRCRSLAPFLSWPDAPRPLLDEAGRLFWLLDGYTLSAAFPLARPLDAAGAFSTPEPDLIRASRLAQPGPQPGAGAPNALPSVSSSPSPIPDAREQKEREEQEATARRRFVTNIIRREEILSRVALQLDGFNWARASVAALVEASTGHVRLFPLHTNDPILSLYRRALPELWSPAQALPAFARAALRTPPHLAALQSAAWANASASNPNSSAGTSGASSGPWRVSGCFFVPTARGLRTGVLHQASDSAPDSNATPASTWAVALSPAPNAQSSGEAHAQWQAHIFAPNSNTDLSRADALVPLEPGPQPARWLARQRPTSSGIAPASTWANQPQQSTTRAAMKSALPGNQNAWQAARDLWRRAKQARAHGERAREQKLSRQLGQLLEHNAAPNR